MSDAWKTYSGAPAEGTPICALADIREPGTLGVDIDGFPVLLCRRNGEVRAFVNACPHQYLPLDYRGDNLLSADGTIIRCTNHEAGYDAHTGEGVEGFGIGCELDGIPVKVLADGKIVVAENQIGPAKE
jgi:nitrite reductase/ring-hydroxylating ferredoxin subunit